MSGFVRWLGAPSGTLGAFSHVTARPVIVQAFEAVFGRAPTLPEAQIAQAVAWGESNYGMGWKGDGVGSNNWGAVQSGKLPCDPATEFEYTDTNPTSSGASIPYRICFRRYPTAADGATHFIQVLYKKRPSVLAAASNGDLLGVSTTMYDSLYYRGVGPSREARIAGHHKTLRANVALIAKANNESMPVAQSSGLLSAKIGWKTVLLVLGAGGLGYYAVKRYR